MGMGIGAAMTGLRPIVEGMNMGFLLLAYNQISNNAGMLHYTSGGQYKVGCPTAFSDICRACSPLPTLSSGRVCSLWRVLACPHSSTGCRRCLGFRVQGLGCVGGHD